MPPTVYLYNVFIVGTSATPSDHVSGSRSSEPTVAGAILDNQISRSQIQFNEIVLQGQYSFLRSSYST